MSRTDKDLTSINLQEVQYLLLCFLLRASDRNSSLDFLEIFEFLDTIKLFGWFHFSTEVPNFMRIFYTKSQNFSRKEKTNSVKCFRSLNMKCDYQWIFQCKSMKELFLFWLDIFWEESPVLTEKIGRKRKVLLLIFFDENISKYNRPHLIIWNCFVLSPTSMEIWTISNSKQK